MPTSAPVSSATIAAALGYAPQDRRTRIVDALRRQSIWGMSSGIRAAGLMSSPPTISVSAAAPSATNIYTVVTPGTAGALSGIFRICGGTILGGSFFARIKAATIWTSGGNIGSNDGAQASVARVEFMADAAIVYLAIKRSAGRYRFLVDDRYVDLTGTLTTAASPTSTNDYVTLDFSSVGGRAVRKISVECQGDGGLYRAYVGATESCYATNPPTIRSVLLGDSYVQGSNATAAGDAWGLVMADWLGIRSHQQSGSGGTGWATTNSAYRFDQRISNGDMGLNGTPDVVFLMGSYNDRNNTPGTITTPGTIAYYAYQGMLAARAAYPNALIVVFGAFPGATGPSAGITAAENAVFAAADAMADALVLKVPVSTASPAGWITGTGKIGTTTGSGNSDVYTDTDGVHPPTAGHAYIGRRAAAAVLDAMASAGW